MYRPFFAALLILVAVTASAQVRLERVDVPGGAELDTLIAGDFPLVSVLVDTMGDSDPTNDTLGNVWVLTYARPTVIQRIVAGLPFVYVRAGSPHRRDDSVPVPMIDMNAAGRATWLKLLHALAQTQLLDPIGLPVRAPSRAYSGNTSAYRDEHIWEAVSVLAAANDDSATGDLSQDELTRIQARLTLSTRILGDLVTDSYLPAAFEKERDTHIQQQQHNWELLRQKAEDNGLYFQPLTLAFSKDANAMLWAERHPPESQAHVQFNAQLLGIGNPFEGDWLAKWKGYTETWTLDESGARVEPGTPGSHQAEMVPVALYSLDYPKTPLLLADFRQPFSPKRREMIRRGADQLATGVLGLTAFGNLEYFAAKTTFFFIRRRHGATLDSSARLRAYSELRHALFLEDPDKPGSLDPKLRAELLRRVDSLGINPFEDGINTEAQLAREQYAALRAYATAPDGLARKIERARSNELVHRLHSGRQIAMYRLATVTTFGIYRHTDHMTPKLLAQVDRQRRFAWHKRFLEQVIDSTPRAEVAYNVDKVQRSLDAITEIAQESDDFRAASEEIVRRVMAQTSDDGMRQRCYECLQRLAMKTPKPAAPPVLTAGGDDQ